MDRLDLIVVGNLSYDTISTPNGYREAAFGGSVAYASLCASYLGERVGVVAKAGKDYDLKDLDRLACRNINIEGIKTTSLGLTTKFENVYDEKESRKQRLLEGGDPIFPEDVPNGYLNAGKVCFLPIFQELPYDTVEKITKNGKCICLDPQGYIRSTDRSGEILLTEWKEKEKILRNIDILSTSAPELNVLAGTEDALTAAERLSSLGPEIVFITREGGSKSSLLYFEGRLEDIPVIPPQILVDPGGVGDASAVAFLVEYEKTDDPWWSAFFATAASSFVMEAYGADSFGNRPQILARIKSFVSRNREYGYLCKDFF
ncbi:MAG: carbohydrate kinase family protein [bacterium]